MRCFSRARVVLEPVVLEWSRSAFGLQLPAPGSAAALRTLGCALSRAARSRAARSRAARCERRERRTGRGARRGHQRASLATPAAVSRPARLRKSGILAGCGSCAYASCPAARRRGLAPLDRADRLAREWLRRSTRVLADRTRGRDGGPASSRRMERSYPPIDTGRQDLVLRGQVDSWTLQQPPATLSPLWVKEQ
jgi:hypothetical protein